MFMEWVRSMILWTSVDLFISSYLHFQIFKSSLIKHGFSLEAPSIFFYLCRNWHPFILHSNKAIRKIEKLNNVFPFKCGLEFNCITNIYHSCCTPCFLPCQDVHHQKIRYSEVSTRRPLLSNIRCVKISNKDLIEYIDRKYLIRCLNLIIHIYCAN